MQKISNRLITALLTSVISVMPVMPSVYAENTKKSEVGENIEENYAMAVFDRQTQFHNITDIPDGESMTVKKEVDGKSCLMGGEGTGLTAGMNGLFFRFDVSKDFMYELPEGTPIEITVEYFDGEEGSFVIDYDSYNTYGDIPNLNSTETVVLQGTNEWKTYTFYIEDARAIKSAGSLGADFRLGLYGIKMGFSLGKNFDVAFRSVKVEYADFREVLISELGSDKIGNIFDENEEIKISHSLKNRSEKNVNATFDYKLYNSENELVEEYSAGQVDFEACGEEKIEFTLKNPNRFEIYKLECISEQWYTDTPDEKKIHTYVESVTKAMLPEKGNMEFGACQQISSGRGEAADLGKSMKDLGITMIRDDVAWSMYDTEAELAENLPLLKERITELNKNGVRYLGVMWNTLRKPMSDGGNVPATDKEINEWAEFCGMMARELKGYTNYFEIWNEYNISMFNTTTQPPEVYVKLLKKSYEAIKAANPDAVIIGGCPSEVDLVFLEKIFELDALDYMDVVSVHPYDWSGEFREGRYVKNMQSLHELMKKYGREIPVWNTELGFGTCTTDRRYNHTREEQASAVVRAWMLNKATKLVDMWMYYMYTDMDNPYDGEACFGFVNGWNNRELTNYGAKESYLALSALNSLIADQAQVVDYDADYTNREYAVNFYNADLGKNVLVMESFNKSVVMNYDLGCESVDFLDMYGNKMATIKSENGIYSFNVGFAPVYAIGRFEKFEKTDTVAGVSADAIEKVCAASDTVKFEFSYSGNSELYIEAIPEEGVKILKNDGFSSGKAELVLEVAADAAEKIKTMVYVKSTAGDTLYCAEHYLKVSNPVDIKIETISDRKAMAQRVRVTVKNVTQSKVLNGEVLVSGPDDAAKINITRKFCDLDIGDEAVFIFNLPSKIVRSTVDMNVTVMLDTGGEYTSSQYLDFASAFYTDTPPVLDGKVEVGEWKGTWIGCDELKDVKENKRWAGPEDQSFAASMMWDEENFYLLAMVTDDVYSMNISPYAPDQMWQGDNIQFSIDDRIDVNPIDASVINELSVGHLDGYGDICFRHSSYYGLAPAVIVEDIDVCIKRYSGYTVYEIKAPWKDILKEGFVPSTDRDYRFSVMINENDGAGRKGWMEYNSGIGATKTVEQFGTLRLYK